MLERQRTIVKITPQRSRKALGMMPLCSVTVRALTFALTHKNTEKQRVSAVLRTSYFYPIFFPKLGKKTILENKK